MSLGLEPQARLHEASFSRPRIMRPREGNGESQTRLRTPFDLCRALCDSAALLCHPRCVAPRRCVASHVSCARPSIRDALVLKRENVMREGVKREGVKREGVKREGVKRDRFSRFLVS